MMARRGCKDRFGPSRDGRIERRIQPYGREAVIRCGRGQGPLCGTKDVFAEIAPMSALVTSTNGDFALVTQL
jgi:hypothetical protein